MSLARPETEPAALGANALKAKVVRLMHDFSLELTPGEMAKMTALPAALRAGSRVYVTWIPGSDFTRTVTTCARLRPPRGQARDRRIGAGRRLGREARARAAHRRADASGLAAVAPADTVLDLARSRLADPASRIERCHFFPFGSFHATAAWAVALAAGTFSLIDEGRDSRID